MPCGSSACLTVRCSSRTSLETASGHQRFLARPMPCSPVIEPPQARTCVKSSSSAASAAALGAGLGVIHHDVGVDVAVAGVAEAGDRQAVLPLQPGGEAKQVLQPAARDDDVFVQLGQAGVAQGIGEFAPDLPDGFALLRRRGRVRRTAASAGGRSSPESRISPRTDLFWPSSSTMRWARQPRRRSLPGAFVGGGEGEGVGHFQRAGQEAGGERWRAASGRRRASSRSRWRGRRETAAGAAASAWLR